MMLKDFIESIDKETEITIFLNEDETYEFTQCAKHIANLNSKFTTREIYFMFPTHDNGIDIYLHGGA